MRRLTVMTLLCTAILLSLPLGLLAQDEQPERLLRVVETSPASGEEHGPAEPIVLYFDSALDCDSAENAVSGDAAGDTRCEGSSLTFTPDGPLDADTTYTLTVADTLRAADGAPLAETFTLTFSTRGYLEVASTVPFDGAPEIEPNSEITVVFNRPVVPLTTIDEQADLPQPLTFDPPTEGDGAWIGTSVYQFKPEPALLGGTEYTVSVDPSLTAQDGAAMAEPFSFIFSTQNPQVLRFSPTAEEADVRLSKAIQVTFNQPMEQESTEEAFFLSIQEVPGEFAGAFEWNDDDTGFMFTPDEPLTLATSYVYGFAADRAMSAGGTQSLAPFSINFFSVPFPEITSTHPADGATDVRPYGGITLYFASPMNPETLLDKITIAPAPENEPDAYFSEWNNQYDVLFPLQADTEYTITIAPGMEDLYGNAIETGMSFSFETGSHDPELALSIPFNGIGLYDADRERTELYVSHLNLERIDLELYSVETEDLVSQIVNEQYYRVLERISEQANRPIKAWSLDGAELRNTRRLDLVNVGEPGTALPINGVAPVECSGAMETRAAVGDRARIVTDPDPTRARSAPVNGDILELLYRDYEFEITGGPTCQNGIIWWEMHLRDGTAAWVAEGLNGEYFFDVTQAATATAVTVSDIELDGGPLPVGVYLLQAQAPELVEERDAVGHIMMVSNTALLMKTALDSTTVWATDIHTGAPVPGITLTLDQGTARLTAVTDDIGVATFTYPRRRDLYMRSVVFVDDGERFGLTVSGWSDGLYPYLFGIPVETRRREADVYLYTDRPVYRPGQPVYFRGIVRAKRDNDYSLPRQDTVMIAVRNANYDIVHRENLDLSAYGTFESTFVLDDEAGLGSYRIEVNVPVTSETSEDAGLVWFSVAEYRLPEYQLAVVPEETEVLRGETIEADFNVNYFFGGPVSNAQVNYTVRSSDYVFDYEGPGFYSFTAFDRTSRAEESPLYIYEEAETAENGVFELEVPPTAGAVGRSQIYTIEGTAYDESGQGVSGRAQVVVHQGDIYVGVAARDYLGAAGQPVTIDLITVDLESEPVPGQSIEVEVIERRWNSVQELDPYGGAILWRSEAEDIPVTTGTVTTDDEGRAEFTFEPANGGSYIVTAAVRDSRGNRVLANTSLWVVGEGYVAWQQDNATAIDVIADKPSYEVGDTAEILITSPFMGRVEALITLERDGVLHAEQVTLESNSTVYRLPIEADFAPTIFFGVTLVKGVDETNPVADMRVGYVALEVNNERFKLNLNVERDVELAGPRDRVTYTITATDYTGEPVQAELGVALTDLATLSLGEQMVPAILEFFYGGEALSVLMSSGMTLNTDLITQFTRDVVKGGGGGGGGDGGIIEVREEFIDTAYWNGALETDENGVATFTITLPDNLTTWRLDVRGVTDGVDGAMLVGDATEDLIATKPLIVRPVAPRFLTVGDEVSLAALVNNNTSEALTVDVGLSATGVSFDAPPVQQVTIPANGRASVTWLSTVEDVETVELIFTAASGEYSDATRPQFGQGDDRLLPVYRYEVPEFVGTGGMLREASTRVESVLLPRRYEVRNGTLTVEVEPSLAVTALKAIEAFEDRFLCECTEATASRLLANVSGLRALLALGDPSDSRISALTTEINLGVQRLVAQQKVDGGWGWYPSLGSDALVTSWAVIALTEAQEFVTVNERTTDAALRYLTNTLSTRDRSDEDYLLNRSAIIVYAMAKGGATRLSPPISNLFDLRDRLDIYAKALLLEAIMILEPADSERIAILRDEIMNAMIVSANGAHWEEDGRDWYNWNSNIRTTAIVLSALLRADADNALLANVVRWLMIARQADAWETTQETAWTLMALTDWMEATGETEPDYAYTVEINEETALEAKLTPADAASAQVTTRDISALNAEGPNPIEISRGSGRGALYYTAYLEAYLPVPEVQPVDNGISVSRTYRLLGSDEPITEAVVGELVEVTVTLIAPNALNFMVLQDPLPAGLEAINPDLSTSQQTGTQASFDTADDDDYFYGYWWADVQYRDEMVVLSADYVGRGTYVFTYVARATVSGEYNVIPTNAREFYLPEVYGRGAGSTFTVRPEPEVN